jgi:hypothetical protein
VLETENHDPLQYADLVGATHSIEWKSAYDEAKPAF